MTTQWTASPLRAFLTRDTLERWVLHHGYQTPHDDIRMIERDWEGRFKRIGQHEVLVSGYMEELRVSRNKIQTLGHGGIDKITRTPLTPPPHLYRASLPEFKNRWCWFDTFQMAKLISDDRAGDVRIYTCDPGEVFGVVRFDRTEPGGYRHQWNEWIVKPTNVREINSWRDPYTEVENPVDWERVGIHAVEASSVIGSWFRSTDSKAAPMDRRGGEYWLLQFKRMGQFEAHSSWDASDRATPQQLKVLPAIDLEAPTRLYRGAPEALKGRWSWSAEPETAQWFIDMFCPDDGKVWVCEAETVFGVINAHITNPQAPFMMTDFTEWIILPDESTIREWDGNA